MYAKSCKVSFLLVLYSFFGASRGLIVVKCKGERLFAGCSNRRLCEKLMAVSSPLTDIHSILQYTSKPKKEFSASENYYTFRRLIYWKILKPAVGEHRNQVLISHFYLQGTGEQTEARLGSGPRRNCKTYNKS